MNCLMSVGILFEIGSEQVTDHAKLARPLNTLPCTGSDVGIHCTRLRELLEYDAIVALVAM
jgi:hypothetical protein